MSVLEVRECSKHTVLALDGEIDLVAAPAVRESLAQIVNDNTDRTVVVDLRDVTFMDSSGIGALLSAHRRLKLQQRAMVIAEPQPIVARVLGLTNIERVIQIADSLTSAVDNCAGVHTAARRPAV
jgi:anti-sigma B factor antagonist